MGMHDHFAPLGALVVRFTDSQGVALGFHILCLWHGTLCGQLARSEFRTNSNASFNCGTPGEQPSRPMGGNRIDLFGSPGFPAFAQARVGQATGPAHHWSDVVGLRSAGPTLRMRKLASRDEANMVLASEVAG